ncbi:hypothetical protein OKW45_004313 [Paraburkholderia sp. WSM4175]
MKTQKYSVFGCRFTLPELPLGQHRAIWRVNFFEHRIPHAFSHGLGREEPIGTTVLQARACQSLIKCRPFAGEGNSSFKEHLRAFQARTRIVVRARFAAPDTDGGDMDDPYDLQRFVDAQGPMHEQICDELRDGRKRSHWMWFVFPQIQGLGESAMAQR